MKVRELLLARVGPVREAEKRQVRPLVRQLNPRKPLQRSVVAARRRIGAAEQRRQRRVRELEAGPELVVERDEKDCAANETESPQGASKTHCWL